MKNKFEALTAFQSWPKEWQRLCAEFWAESDMDVPVVLQEGGARFTSRAEPSLPAIGDPFPHSDLQPRRAAKVFRKDRKVSVSQPWTIREDDYLQKCVAEHPKLSDAVRQFLAVYPGRSTDAIRRRVWGTQKGKVT